MTQIKIKIPTDECVAVERSFYEYNAGLNIITYLMQQDDINEKYLQDYINITEKRNVELELKKRAMDLKYHPNEYGDKVVRYEFDFENEELIYTVED